MIILTPQTCGMLLHCSESKGFSAFKLFAFCKRQFQVLASMIIDIRCVGKACVIKRVLFEKKGKYESETQRVVENKIDS